MPVRALGVVGCGIMGGGIAQVCATSGYDVMVVEADAERLEKGLSTVKGRLAREASRGRLTEDRHQRALEALKGALDLADLAECDLVIEAVVEDLPVKQQVFAELGSLCKPETILASNTSSLPIAALAAASGRPDQVLGLHFFNPPTVLKLLEFIPAETTSGQTTEEALAFVNSIDRVVVQAKDTPGFIVNRLLAPFIFDAIRLVENGVASARDVDQACKAGLSHTMGPLATADLVGLDTLLHIGDFLFEEYGEPQFKAPVMLRRMISLGRLGRKSGRGFFNYQKEG